MEFIDSVADTLFWFFIGYGVAKLLFVWLDYRIAQRLEQEVGTIIRDLDSGKLIPLTVELHNDQFFCYNSLTDDFVCQGHTLSEIAERFNLRYPGCKAAIHRGEEEVIKTLKQQFKDGVENISLTTR